MPNRKEIEKQLKCVDADAILMVLEVAYERYRELFPDWEIVSFSIEKCKDRNAQIDRIVDIMQGCKDPERQIPSL